MNELEFIGWLADRLAERDPQLPLGLRDDTALLPGPADSEFIATTDMLLEGVHFLTGEDPERVGRKALAVNLSDIAAMAAEPMAALVSVALPKQGGFAVGQQLYHGLLRLADEYHLPIAGGDTNSWNSGLVVSVTVFGRPTKDGLLQRSTAKPGDAILVTGSLGASLASQRHLGFAPRVREALALNAKFDLHAGMDISDGLLIDLQRLVSASGCGAVLDVAAVPVSDAAMRLSHTDHSKSALERALTDGEDFELLLTAPAPEAERIVREAQSVVPVTIIGRVQRARGVWQVGADGELEEIKITGYQHPLQRMNSFIFEADTARDTARLAQALQLAIPGGTLVVLSGTLGAGKTTLVRDFAAAAGVPNEDVTSPTYVLCQQYQGHCGAIYHLDLYRVTSAEEVWDLALDELLETGAILFVEWGERFAECLPDDYLHIRIDVAGPEKRRFDVVKIGQAPVAWWDQLTGEL